MKYFGIYANTKHFILNASDHWYRFLNRSDDWVESQNHDTLSMYAGIGLVFALVLIILCSWAINKSEDTPQERENEKKKKSL